MNLKMEKTQNKIKMIVSFLNIDGTQQQTTEIYVLILMQMYDFSFPMTYVFPLAFILILANFLKAPFRTLKISESQLFNYLNPFDKGSVFLRKPKLSVGSYFLFVLPDALIHFSGQAALINLQTNISKIHTNNKTPFLKFLLIFIDSCTILILHYFFLLSALLLP